MQLTEVISQQAPWSSVTFGGALMIKGLWTFISTIKGTDTAPGLFLNLCFGEDCSFESTWTVLKGQTKGSYQFINKESFCLWEWERWYMQEVGIIEAVRNKKILDSIAFGEHYVPQYYLIFIPPFVIVQLKLPGSDEWEGKSRQSFLTKEQGIYSVNK